MVIIDLLQLTATLYNVRTCVRTSENMCNTHVLTFSILNTYNHFVHGYHSSVETMDIRNQGSGSIIARPLLELSENGNTTGAASARYTCSMIVLCT